ncbi:TniB family NTP-binding protein [Pseudoalteromonas sp. Isolate6]|uniref:TniB family NTP-binding protein n=1 Tax=Pseudoalteromonas sp. Isolate6 TaxID=2908527 RepID=UPI001EFD417F|nr:TniB family NTP-binding protein [Pseudoalteromonas sp. Isolate6]MCG9760858.1 TniB family NTP-binding protein [Pseudoalteromonas sp. Isolate6]
MNHLEPKVAQLLNLPKETRIAELKKKKWIGYSAANKVLAKMEDLLNHPKTHRMPNLLIKSDTNNGKSFLLKRFIKSHPSYENYDSESLVIPVVSIEIPSEPTPDVIYSLILQAMHIPYRDSYKKEVKSRKVFDAFERFGVRMLIIDELHVLMNTTKLKKAQLLDTLKYIGNTTQVVIVGAGTMEAHTAIVSDGQLANRFEPAVLPQWKLNTDYRKLLATFELIIPLEQPSDLQSQLIATEVYSMSSGWIGEINEILTRSAIKAINSGEERITLDILRSIDWLTPERRRYTGISG